MHRVLLSALVGCAAAASLAACELVTSTQKSVFILFDASGTYAKAVPAAAQTAAYLISELQPGDWFGVGQITSCSFTDEAIILQERLPETPSRASEAKRATFTKLKAYAGQVKPTQFTDIHGALAQAAFELKQRGVSGGPKHIVIFSDMVEDLAGNCDTSDVALDLSGMTVVASNVIKSDPSDPAAYFETLKQWEATVTEAGGKWVLATSPDQLPGLVAAR